MYDVVSNLLDDWVLISFVSQDGRYSMRNSIADFLQVYADQYLDVLDAPAELSPLEFGDSSGFRVSVQMRKPGIGPYACLVYHDTVSSPLTVGELQEQFSWPYSEFTTNQVLLTLCKGD